MTEKSIAQMLRSVLFQSDGFPYCFYGKYSRMGLDISIDGKLQLHIAECNDPDAKNRTYNNDNRVNFTISASECYHIVSNFKEIMTGEWRDTKQSDEKYKKIFQIAHFVENSSSRLLLEPSNKGALKVTIVPPKESGKKALSYVLSYDKQFGLYERAMFLDFVKAVATTGPYNAQLFKSKIKTLREMLRKEIELDGNNQNKNQNNANTRSNRTNEKYSQKVDNKIEESPSYNSYSGDEFDGFSDTIEDEIPF